MRFMPLALRALTTWLPEIKATMIELRVTTSVVIVTREKMPPIPALFAMHHGCIMQFDGPLNRGVKCSFGMMFFI